MLGPPPAGPDRPASGLWPVRLVRPLTAGLLAGAGGAGVWTFGPEVTTRSGLSPGAAGLLWRLLGAAALLGDLGGSVVRRVGLAVAWRVSAVITATGTVLLARWPGSIGVAAGALALFGCGFVALSGLLIAWGSRLAPEAPAQATALLFIALTIGQAAGAAPLGTLADTAGAPVTFVAAAALVSAATLAAPRDRRR